MIIGYQKIFFLILENKFLILENEFLKEKNNFFFILEIYFLI